MGYCQRNTFCCHRSNNLYCCLRLYSCPFHGSIYHKAASLSILLRWDCIPLYCHFLHRANIHVCLHCFGQLRCCVLSGIYSNFYWFIPYYHQFHGMNGECFLNFSSISNNTNNFYCGSARLDIVCVFQFVIHTISEGLTFQNHSGFGNNGIASIVKAILHCHLCGGQIHGFWFFLCLLHTQFCCGHKFVGCIACGAGSIEPRIFCIGRSLEGSQFPVSIIAPFPCCYSFPCFAIGADLNFILGNATIGRATPTYLAGQIAQSSYLDFFVQFQLDIAVFWVVGQICGANTIAPVAMPEGFILFVHRKVWAALIA